MTPDSPEQTPTADDAALDRQVRTFLESRPLIHAHIGALVRDASLAEDVFQEVWLRFERATRKGEMIAHVPAWCRATARLVALETWRERRREQPLPDEELAALVDRAYEEQDDHEEFWQGHVEALGRCMEALPVRSRELLTLRYRQGESVNAIAAQLRQSTGSVKTALCRLRLALAECVKGKMAAQQTL
jgi:RNA polymerase sigma-70 factor, ECF subfamily